MRILVVFILGGLGAIAQTPTQGKRPLALALIDESRELFVACRDSGSLVRIDAERLEVKGETVIGRRLNDLVAFGASGLIAADEAMRELIWVGKNSAGDPRVRARLAVPGSPHRILAMSSGTTLLVSSLWARCLFHVRSNAEELAIEWTLDLPFPPGEIVEIGADRALVADAFGGRLALIDTAAASLVRVWELPASNIRGMIIDPVRARLFMSHQLVSQNATSSFDDVHWGLLITNHLREIPLRGFREARPDALKGSRLHRLGEVGNGAADPAGLALDANHRPLIALGGVGELAVAGKRPGSWRRVAVGDRPTVVQFDEIRGRAFTADTFSNSVSVVDPKTGELVTQIRLGRDSATAVERGERLFHSGRLSHDGWMSCASCHPRGHTIGLLADTESDGDFGSPKRVPSLLGLAGTAPFAWTGRFETLEAQLASSMTTTMRGERNESEIADLAAFLRAQPAPPSAPRQRSGHETLARQRGRAVFEKLDCTGCHEGDALTSDRVVDVGLRDESGHTRFNPPSLRGLGQRERFFHDGRAANLRAVLVDGHHPSAKREEIDADRLRQLMLYLRSL